MSSSIMHQPDEQQFSVTRNGYTAELAYSLPAPGVIDFNHTYVDEGLRGRGVAQELARTALAYARDQQLRVRTSCEFMAGYVQRHPEYQSLLAA
ncbi:GNAT family N-acetyltransferase [Hymenobacter weizhouensis]|uniref:GNAT family N-acetyltransferase n=1 Tax=Hymenobacter sp. YIM 151500-1 TaxID=2987689 RepID=UPI002227255F|nr:GNAT family N-acetyltransferase [Hymenobacter sp. YIM 151500-1]UYZ64766.1 N-acetyltransferase [Hymenobacter sp. YIM 151500-1]